MLLTQRICKFIKDIITLQNYNIYIFSQSNCTNAYYNF